MLHQNPVARQPLATPAVSHRRRTLRALALFAVLAVLCAGCDWAQYRYGPAHTGFSPFETTIGSQNVSGLQTRWFQKVGIGLSGDAVEAPMAIADGALYARSDTLYAFDASNGSARWSSPGIGWATSSPAVANGVVYVTGNKLYAFNAATGAQLWSAAVVRGTSPAVVGGVVYVTADKLYAFNAATGAQLWSTAVERGTSPAVVGGVVYVTADKLYAFNAATGAQLWSTAALGGNSSPAVANGVVYITGGDAQLYAFNAATGVQLWSRYAPGSQPAVANGVVYLSGYQVYAYDAKTGTQLWSSAQRATPYSPPSVANGVVYLSADNPCCDSGGGARLYALNAATGVQLWSGGGGANPTIANGVVYATDAYGIGVYSLPITTPQLSISPAFPHEFALYQAMTFTITNIGSTPTSHIADGLSGPDAAHFRVTSDACAGVTLAGGASCAVNVSFTPTQSGRRTASLTTTATTGGTATARLVGTAAPLTLTPSYQSFDNTYAGSTSTARVLTLTNLSPGPVGPIGNSITPTGAFVIDADACAGKMIAAGGTCTIAVKFTPPSNEFYADSLISEASGLQAQAQLVGSGLGRLAITPGSKDFGSVRVGTTASATFTVTNISPSSAGPITATTEEVFGPLWYSITSDACAGRTLAPNANCTLVVTFAPPSVGGSLGRLKATAPLAGVATADLTGTGA
jgi:outer membrane protein assembly factor BamB